ncbi:unnamed protein product, partial [Allacma fusca]
MVSDKLYTIFQNFKHNVKLRGVTRAYFNKSEWERNVIADKVSWKYLSYRGAYSAYFIIWLAINIARSKHPNLYIIQATHWSFVIQAIYGTIYFSNLAYRFFQYRRTASKISDGDGRSSSQYIRPPTKLNIFDSITWLLLNIAGTIPYIVSVGYWAFVFKPNSSNTQAGDVLLNLTSHGFNALLALVDTFVTAIPIRVAHCLYTVTFTIAYLLFSLFYELADGAYSNPDEPYIYRFLNWREEPGMTTLSCVIALFAAILLHTEQEERFGARLGPTVDNVCFTLKYLVNYWTSLLDPNTMNHILLVILLETLPIILFSSSTVIEDPLIQYCGPGQNGSGNTHGCFQSISEFQFGNINQNVLNLSSPTTGTSSRWTLRCQATYPIRWVIQSYNGRVRQRGNSDSLRMNQNPFQNSTGLIFYQDIWISDGMGRETAMRSASSRILRCESFSNSSLASVIFLNRSGSSTILEFAGSPEDVYIFIVDSKRARQEGSFIVPCAARNIPPLAMNDIKLIETDRHDMRTGQISDGCIECICYAMSGNCEKAPCNDCGSIGQLYWTDGNMYNPNDKPYATCVVDPQCSRQTIKGYMKRYGGDCNNDGIVNCLDYLKIHNTGLDECENADLGHVGTRFNSCWSEQNLTVLDPSTASYDPRLGFRVKGSPNFNNSVYTCSSIPKFVDGIENVAKFVSFAPVNSDLEVEGSVLYRRAEEDLCCHTIPNTRIMSGIHLIFVLCDNITDCDLKFRSNTNLNSVRLQTFMHIPLSGEFAENNSVIRLGLTDDTHHGFIECSGVFQNPPNKNYGSFVKKLDYIFTGLDDDKYLVSDSYPTSAVINIVKQNEASSQDLKHEFRCKISTFVLLPNVRFGIEFQNGTRILIDTSSNRSTYGEATVQQLALPSDVRLAITSWQLLITLKPNVRKLMCFAPWINSTRWAESEIPVTIDSVASSVGAILGYCFASLAIIFLIVAAVVWYKYKKAKLRKRTMTEDEIKEFYHGNPNEKKAPDGTVIVENIAFNEKMKIPSESLHT